MEGRIKTSGKPDAITWQANAGAEISDMKNQVQRKSDSLRIRHFISATMVIGIFSGLLLPATTLPAQIHDFQWYDSTTYHLYQQKNWVALSETGRQALREGFDYYYLRMRLGIAAFERGRYRLAANHYYRAVAFSETDPAAMEMLYYSLLYGGRWGEARQAGALLKTTIRSPLVEILGVQAETGMRSGPQTNPVGNLFFANTGLNHSIGRRLILTHRYQYLTQKLRVFEEIDTPGSEGSGNGEGQSPTRYAVSEPQVKQQEYYLGATLHFGKGWQMGMGWHPLWITDSASTYQNAAYAFTFSKDWAFLNLAASLGWNELNSHTDMQYGVFATLYPLANTRLFYTAGASLKTHHEEGAPDYEHLIIQQLGARIFQNTWLTDQSSFGEISNFSEKTASLVYNFSDSLTRRYGGGIQYWINERHPVYLIFLKEEKKAFGSLEKFSQNLFVAGVQFNF